MAVMEREQWTDERLDKAFDRIDADLRELRVETRKGFERVDGKLGLMQSEMNMRFEAVQRNMTLWFVSLFGTILACLVTAGAALISLV